jgi:hypothetical protein
MINERTVTGCFWGLWKELCEENRRKNHSNMCEMLDLMKRGQMQGPLITEVYGMRDGWNGSGVCDGDPYKSTGADSGADKTRATSYASYSNGGVREAFTRLSTAKVIGKVCVKVAEDVNLELPQGWGVEQAGRSKL